MQRTHILGLVLVMAFSFAGCGDEPVSRCGDGTCGRYEACYADCDAELESPDAAKASSSVQGCGNSQDDS